MIDRNTRPGTSSTRGLAQAGLLALAIVGLAGGTAAVAQSSQSSKGKAATAPAAPAAEAAPAAAPQVARSLAKKAGGDRDPMAKGSPSDQKKVNVDENLIVDLHVNDEDLVNVLQMLSIQSQKSILTSKNVAATVTANLYGVTFYEALDAILHVNGYGYVERGNFIFVYTLEELQKIADAQRQRVWKTVKLNHLNATDAAEFVKPLLSEGGQIKTNGKTGNFAISENAPSGADEFAQAATMLVFDFEENLAEIEKVVKELDTKPAQVLVEATILQTALNEANAFGVDFSVISDLNFSDFVSIGGPLRAVDGLIGGSDKPGGGGSAGSSGSSTGGSSSGTSSSGNALPADGKGSAITSTAGNTAGPGTMKLGIVQGDVAAFVRLLDEVADTQIVSRPNILTLNRMPARVLVGRKVGYLNTTTTDTATSQTVEFLDTGTQLYFRPFVSVDGSIRMELKPKVSEAVIRNVTDQSGRTVTIPDEVTNEITTNVTVRDGQTVVLGGLFRESTSQTRRQVPFAGDIPIIGAAFRGHDDSTQRSEIIFMITPSIVNDETLLDQSKRADANIERVRSGSRTGLLPWSREKRGSQMLVEATELARNGNREQALNVLSRSLRLNPNQPDAIQLREALLNQKSQWPTRSMQHEIITGELQKKIQGIPAQEKLPMSSAPGNQSQVEERMAEPTFVAEVAPQNTLAAEPELAPVAEPVNEPVVEPASEPAVEPVAGVDPTTGAMAPSVEPAVDPSFAPSFDPTNEPAGEPTSNVEPGAEPSEMSSNEWIENNAEAGVGSDGTLEVVVETAPAKADAKSTFENAKGGLSSNASVNTPAPSAGLTTNAVPKTEPVKFPSVSNMWRNFQGKSQSAGVQPTNTPGGR